MTEPSEINVRLYSVAQVAKLWGTGVSYVYTEIADGRLPTVQLGRGDRNKLRVAARDVEAYIEAHRTIDPTRLSRRPA